MPSFSQAVYIKNYRLEHPDFREKEKTRDRTYANNKYKTDEDNKERKKEYNRQRYYKLKELKLQETSVINPID